MEVEHEPIVSIQKIREKLNLKNPDERLKGLLHGRKLIQEQLSDELFLIGLENIDDKNNDCRWQALIIVGEFIETKPSKTWKVIMKYGKPEDEDMRIAVSTILLEHYFEKNPELFNPKFRELKREIEAGNVNYKKTLASCWSDFGGETNKRRVEQLLFK